MIYIKSILLIKLLITLFLASLLFLNCEPWNLKKKVFPDCSKPEVTVSTITNNLNVAFSLSNQKGPITRALWNFGDGVAFAQLNTNPHTYQTSGTYKIRLEIWNACDESTVYNLSQTVTALPTVTTMPTYTPTDKILELNMQVVSNGGFVINKYGICLSSINSSPTIDNSIINSSNANPIISNNYLFSFSNLTPNTKYYYRAFAQNAFGISYGSVQTANTLKSCNIAAKSTGSYYILQIPTQKLFYQKEAILVTMFSSTYSFGQATKVELYDEDTLIYNYGSYLVFNSNSKVLILPEKIPISNCYNIRITSYEDVYISPVFSIIPSL